MCCFVCHLSGLRLAGKYEVKPDGTGLIPWRQIRFENFDTNRVLSTSHRFSALIPRHDYLFFILDHGIRANNITFIEDLSSDELKSDKFDIVVIAHR